MPLDRFVLILVIVFAAAGLSVWIATAIAAATTAPGLWFLAVPVVLAVAVLWRVIAQRLNNPEDDHYDTIEK
ncbi:hypothetical protein [Oceaniglobus roseus]|uniref:hypothetical protein n=1 Tax=Oceaniglobus roseus TaxID=1737570 RepID=UPI000C7ED7B2|nr:hypothetical protein [Kandeliimicrobium roseum]